MSGLSIDSDSNDSLPPPPPPPPGASGLPTDPQVPNLGNPGPRGLPLGDPTGGGFPLQRKKRKIEKKFGFGFGGNNDEENPCYDSQLTFRGFE